MQKVREVIQKRNLSENSIDHLMNWWTSSMCEKYSLHIIRWLEFAFDINIDSCNAFVNDGAEFLKKHFMSLNLSFKQ